MSSGVPHTDKDTVYMQFSMPQILMLCQLFYSSLQPKQKLKILMLIADPDSRVYQIGVFIKVLKSQLIVDSSFLYSNLHETIGQSWSKSLKYKCLNGLASLFPVCDML